MPFAAVNLLRGHVQLSRTAERIYLTGGLIGAAGASLAPFLIVPAFQSVFQKLGADLPFVTLLALKLYPALLAVPLLVVGAWFFWPRRENRALAAFGIGVASLVVVPILLVLAMNLPIWRLGAGS